MSAKPGTNRRSTQISNGVHVMRILIECALTKLTHKQWPETAGKSFLDLRSVPGVVGGPAGLRMIAVAVLMCACGNDEMVGGSSGGAGPATGAASNGSGGDESTEASGGGDSGNGGSQQGSGGDGGDSASGGNEAATEECELVDGEVAYGPIGEPWPLAPRAISRLPEEYCQSCSQEGDYAAFPTTSGYGFVWRTTFDTDAPAPNLFTMTVGSNFEGGEPRPIAGPVGVGDLEVAPAKEGFVVSTCASGDKPAWLWLTDDLEAAGSPTFAPPGALCRLKAPPIVWTGERYLTAFTDARGLVVAAFDAEGTVIGEEIVSNEVDPPSTARFSKNADRTLLVFSAESGDRGRFIALDSAGKPLGGVQPIGEEDPDQNLWNGIAGATDDGWLIVSDMRIPNKFHTLFTFVSKDGARVRETEAQLWGVIDPKVLTRSASGGSLFVGRLYETGQFGRAFTFVARIDDAGEVVYMRESDNEMLSDGPWADGVVIDPERDLVVEVHGGEESESTLVVQEYGCLE